MSTRSEGKDDGEGKCEGKDADASSPKREKFAVVDKVHEFCTSSEFEGSFEEFTKEYSSIFVKALDFNSGDEHPIEFHNVYREYLQRFERKIEVFIEDSGFRPVDFYNECQELLESEDLYGSRRFFIEALLATSEYDSFFSLMRSEMEKFRNDGK